MKETLRASLSHERNAQIAYLGQYVARLLERRDDDEHLLAIKAYYEAETGSLLVADKKSPHTSEPPQPKQEYPTDFDQWPDDER